MRVILRLIKQRQVRNVYDNYYWQLWFRYHTVFFGSLIFSGYKNRAFRLFCLIKQGLKIKEKQDPYKVFLVSLMMVTPIIYALPIKLGGRSFGVPLPISEKKKVTLGVRFVIKLLKERKNNLSVNSIVDILSSAVYGAGPAIERKANMYKSASLNRHLVRKVFKKINKKVYFKEHKEGRHQENSED